MAGISKFLIFRHCYAAVVTTAYLQHVILCNIYFVLDTFCHVKQKQFSGYKLNAQHQEEMRAPGAQWNDCHHRVQWAQALVS